MMLSGTAPSLCLAANKVPCTPKRTLSFYNTHTGESLSTIYWSDGTYDAYSLDDINTILRDHRTGEIKPISLRLLDLLYAIKTRLGPDRQFHIISGYRSPKTNAILCVKSSSVAKKSLHMRGEAVDFFLPGCKLSLLRNTAINLQAGGVGYYPRLNFIHIDVGRIRSW
jgi:uncharacterized protein YcbK (DUF882 family)